MKVKVRNPKGGRPKGIPCKWKGKKPPWKPKKVPPKMFTDKMKKWADNYMENTNGTNSAIIAYELNSDSPADKKYAALLGWKNKKHPLVQEYMRSVTEVATSTIVHLAQYSENDRVRLSASQDILDRLGYKPVEKLEIDDRRELSDIDKEAIKRVQEVLTGVIINEAEIDEQPNPIESTEPYL